MQADSRPSPIAERGGRPAAQEGVAVAQRGMKAHAAPTVSGGGGAPPMGRSGWRACRASGTERSSPSV
jgi:hypothetical protein